MPQFRAMADVLRRAGIYGPRDYLAIVEEQIKYWAIEGLSGLNELGKRAQEKILGIPARLNRVADVLETRSRAKSFVFDVAFARVTVQPRSSSRSSYRSPQFAPCVPASRYGQSACSIR